MKKGVRSARGQMVDFNLYKLKQQIGVQPKPLVVKAREDFIDRKLKRRTRNLTATVTAPETAAAQPEVVLDQTDDIVDVVEGIDENEDAEGVPTGRQVKKRK